MPTLVPGLTITETSTPTIPLDRQRIGSAIFVVTRSVNGSGADKSLQRVASTSELTAKVGTIPAIAQASIERFLAIAPRAELYVIPSDTGATSVLKLQAGINAIPTAATALDLAVIVCPEAAAESVQADRTTLYNAGEAVAAANGWDWLHFFNFGLTTNTKTLADAESLLYTSPQGNSSKFYGFSRDASNRQVPLCVDAAAWLIQLAQTRDLFRSPAGLDCPIPAASIDPAFLLSFPEANDVMQGRRGYNFAWQIRSSSYLWNCVTGAVSPSNPDLAWANINSRLSMSTLQARLAIAGIAALFQPSNVSTGNNSALGKIAAVYAVVAAWSQEGGTAVPPLTADGVQPPPYRVVPVDVSSGNQTVQLRVWPIQSDREISYTLINTSTP